MGSNELIKSQENLDYLRSVKKFNNPRLKQCRLVKTKSTSKISKSNKSCLVKTSDSENQVS